MLLLNYVVLLLLRDDRLVRNHFLDLVTRINCLLCLLSSLGQGSLQIRKRFLIGLLTYRILMFDLLLSSFRLTGIESYLSPKEFLISLLSLQAGFDLDQAVRKIEALIES